MSLRADCVYEISRVGKVQGIRTKRKKTHEALSQSDDGTEPQSSRTQTQLHNNDGDEEIDSETREEGQVCDVTSPHEQASYQRDQDPLHAWSPEPWASWNDSFLSLDNNLPLVTDHTVGNAMASMPDDTLQVEIPSSTSASGFENQFPALCSNNMIESSHTSSSADTVPQLMPPRPSVQRMATLSTEAMAALNSKCIIALADITITLENYLRSNLKVLDLIVTSVRSVADELKKVALHQRQLRNERCMFLSITVMYQVIALLESGSLDILGPTSTNRDQPGGAGGSIEFRPRLGFGVLSAFSEEEQRSMKIHVIRKECQNMDEIIAEFVALAKLGPEGSAPPTSAELEERAKCFTGLQRRLKVLSSKASMGLQ